jgi:hypothetical protein
MTAASLSSLGGELLGQVEDGLGAAERKQESGAIRESFEEQGEEVML